MKKALITIAIAGVIILAIAVVTLLSLPRSPKQFVDLAQLQPAWQFIPSESNAFPHLLEAGALLTLSEDDESALSDIGSGTIWDEVKARELLHQNGEALTGMQEALSRPFFQLAHPHGFEEEWPYLRQWRLLANLTLVRAYQSFNNGDESAAFERAMEVVEFGQKIEASEGGVLHYLTGSAIKGMGLHCIRQLTEKTALPPDKLLLTAKHLIEFEAQREFLHRTLKSEFTATANRFDALGTSNLTSVLGKSVRMPSFFFDPQTSKADLGLNILQVMAAVTNCYFVGTKGMPVGVVTNTGKLRLILGGNVTGKILNDMSLLPWESLLFRKCRENVEVRATRTILALRAFQKVNGATPQTLEELVPAFLETIPLDDFDGKPMRYIAASNLVYSVGQDLVDSGGEKSTDREKGDIVFSFGF